MQAGREEPSRRPYSNTEKKRTGPFSGPRVAAATHLVPDQQQMLPQEEVFEHVFHHRHVLGEKSDSWTAFSPIPARRDR